MDREFFRQDAACLAPALVGKIIARKLPDGTIVRLRIDETEAYCGTEDTACHASKGKTSRNELLWRDGGTVYVYLCYGMHWLMNIISGTEGDPQGVLIRSCVGYNGPGKLTKALGIDKHFNGADILGSDEIWLEDDGKKVDIILDKRVGIAYAEEKDREALLRFKMG